MSSLHRSDSLDPFKNMALDVMQCRNSEASSGNFYKSDEKWLPAKDCTCDNFPVSHFVAKGELSQSSDACLRKPWIHECSAIRYDENGIRLPDWRTLRGYSARYIISDFGAVSPEQTDVGIFYIGTTCSDDESEWGSDVESEYPIIEEPRNLKEKTPEKEDVSTGTSSRLGVAKPSLNVTRISKPPMPRTSAVRKDMQTTYSELYNRIKQSRSVSLSSNFSTSGLTSDTSSSSTQVVSDGACDTSTDVQVKIVQSGDCATGSISDDDEASDVSYLVEKEEKQRSLKLARGRLSDTSTPNGSRKAFLPTKSNTGTSSDEGLPSIVTREWVTVPSRFKSLGKHPDLLSVFKDLQDRKAAGTVSVDYDEDDDRTLVKFMKEATASLSRSKAKYRSRLPLPTW